MGVSAGRGGGGAKIFFFGAEMPTKTMAAADKQGPGLKTKLIQNEHFEPRMDHFRRECLSFRAWGRVFSSDPSRMKPSIFGASGNEEHAGDQSSQFFRSGSQTLTKVIYRNGLGPMISEILADKASRVQLRTFGVVSGSYGLPIKRLILLSESPNAFVV